MTPAVVTLRAQIVAKEAATGVDAFDDIHRRLMCVKLRCRLTGPECPLLAFPEVRSAAEKGPP